MFDMIRLALETDSTRLVTLFINTLGVATDIPGVEHETHTLTHHGNRPETLAELRTIEAAQFQALAGLLAGLKGTKEGGETLLDRTMVLYGTCMGSANAHSNVNLPVLLAGGGFKHAGHPGVRHQEELPAAEPVRVDAPAPRPGGRQVRVQHRHHARPGDGVIPCGNGLAPGERFFGPLSSRSAGLSPSLGRNGLSPHYENPEAICPITANSKARCLVTIAP